MFERPKGILKCVRPKMKTHRGRTWDTVDIILLDGSTIQGFMDYTWGWYFYFKIEDQWYKGKNSEFSESGMVGMVTYDLRKKIYDSRTGQDIK